MKIIVKNSKELCKAVKLLSPLANSNKGLPILQHILVDATEGVRLIATDLETVIRVDASEMFEVAKSGAVCIPPSFLKELANETVIETDTENQNFARIGKNKVAVMLAEDFPLFPDLDSQEMGRVEIGAIIKRVIHASGESLSRFNTECICLNFTTQEVVATDSHRLAIVKDCLPHSPAIENEDDQLLVNKTAAKILTGVKGEVSIARGKDHSIFSWDRITMLARLVGGIFPEVYNVIPESFDFAIEVESLPLINTTKKAMKISRKGAAIEFKIDGEAMTVSATNPGLGEFRDDVKISNPLDVYCVFGINPTYLIDALKETGKTTKFEFVKEVLRPIKFTGDNPDFLSVIMPYVIDREFISIPVNEEV